MRITPENSKISLHAILLAILCSIAPKAYSTAHNNDKPVKIALYHITGMLEFGQQHPYNRALKALTDNLKTPTTMQIFHGLRAVRQFRSGRADCVFPASKTRHRNGKTIASLPVAEAKAYFFAEQRHSSNQLLDKTQPKYKIAFQRGNSFGGTITQLAHHELMPINSGADVREMLKNGRFDIFLNYIPDALPVINSQGYSKLLYDESNPFYTQQDSMICHQSVQNQQFIQSLNQRLIALEETGEMASLLGIAADHKADTQRQPRLIYSDNNANSMPHLDAGSEK